MSFPRFATIWQLIRYEGPLSLISTLTFFLPDLPIFCRLRGWLGRPFIGKCGRDFQFGRLVRFMHPGKLTVGDHVYIAEGAWICAIAGCRIENETLIGPRCLLLTTHHGRENGSFRFAKGKMAPIHVGRGSWLGANVVVTPGTTIGSGCLIGANSVVSQDVGSNTLVRPASTQMSPIRKS
ncbi:acyltransferase [Rhodopirellula baltica]